MYIYIYIHLLLVYCRINFLMKYDLNSNNIFHQCSQINYNDVISTKYNQYIIYIM